MHDPRDATAPCEIAGRRQDPHEIGAGGRTVSGSDGLVQRDASGCGSGSIEDCEAVGHGDPARIENAHLESWKLARSKVCGIHR